MRPKLRPKDWFDPEHAQLVQEGRSWGTVPMYRAKLASLQWALASRRLSHSCRVLDVGCGTGDLAALLFENGIENVDGFDISSVAIAQASKRARGAFRVVDFSEPSQLPERYDCIFDTDCFQMITTPAARTQFLLNIKSHLAAEGVFLTGLNSSRPGIDPFVTVEDSIQYYWPTRPVFEAELSSVGFTLLDSRTLPPRNTARCDSWHEMLFSLRK
jgi:cyclopropane fatty-acyl-phospholipid synthase-like methyltransferase